MRLERSTTRDHPDWLQDVASLNDVFYMRAAGPRRHHTAPLVALPRLPEKFVAIDWDNETDENVIESVTL